jgi:NAD(P)-dependent dehydrogenase (short-subunit alcohol dehydrogenase family)
MTATDPGPGPRRAAVVTGGSRGLGAVVARLLAGEGFDLVVIAREPGPLWETVKSLRSFGGRVVEISGDVTDPELRARVRAAVDRFGGLDLLVNNASELGASPLPPLAEYPIEQLERVYRVNVIAPVALVQSLLPALTRRHGLIVNISSDAAVGGYPGWGAYGASKAALDLVSVTLSHELEGVGVAAVSVDPGDMRTRMQQAAFPGQDISNRPLPDATLPFWAWLLGQPVGEINGHRYRAQADHWGASA